MRLNLWTWFSKLPMNLAWDALVPFESQGFILETLITCGPHPWVPRQETLSLRGSPEDHKGWSFYNKEKQNTNKKKQPCLHRWSLTYTWLNPIYKFKKEVLWMFFIIFGEFVAVLDYLRTQIRHNSTRQMFQKMPGNGHFCWISLVK